MFRRDGRFRLTNRRLFNHPPPRPPPPLRGPFVDPARTHARTHTHRREGSRNSTVLSVQTRRLIKSPRIGYIVTVLRLDWK